MIEPLAREGFSVTDIDHARPEDADPFAAPLPGLTVPKVHGLAGHGIVDEQVADKGVALGGEQGQ